MSTNRRPGLARSLPSSGITIQVGRVQMSGPSFQDINQAAHELSGQNWTQGTGGGNTGTGTAGTTTTTQAARPRANISPAARQRMREGAARARAARAAKLRKTQKTMAAGG